MRRDERFDVGSRPHLNVEVGSGNLAVQTHELASGNMAVKTQVVVVREPGVIGITLDAPKADEFDISQIGDTVSIREGSRWRSGGRSVRIVVEVPPGTDVTVKVAACDVVLRGRFGDVRCRTASGDLQIDEADRLDASTASGDLRAGSVNGDGTFHSASGRVTVNLLRGRLSASLASGDLAAVAAGAGIDVGTASGHVSVDRCDGSDIRIKTVSGNIRLGLPSGIRVEPEIFTMSGIVSLPAAGAQTGVQQPGVERRTVRVRLRSVSGDVQIERVG